MTENLENKCGTAMCAVKCFYNNASTEVKMNMLAADVAEYNKHDTCPGTDSGKPCYHVWPRN